MRRCMMTSSEKAEKIIEAMRTLDDFDQNLFLHALLGLVKLDCPQSIVDAAKWTSVSDKLQEALDKLD